jgi:uncharacterized membrane protein
MLHNVSALKLDRKFADEYAEVLDFSGIAWPNSRMFESIQRDPRRPMSIENRSNRTTMFDSHAHLAQATAGVNASQLAVGYASGPGETGRPSPSDGIHPLPPAPTLPLHSVPALSNGDDPFMGPSSAVSRWRGKVSHSTDDTMPDFEHVDSSHTRGSTDMSGVSWPRRDFQRHMDEAAIDEIIEALSPEKRNQLKEVLSPAESSSSGINAPSNTPKTASASKLPSPIMAPSEVELALKTKRPKKVQKTPRPTTEDSPDSSSSSEVTGGRGAAKSTVRAMLTRSQKKRQAEMLLSAKRRRSGPNDARKKQSLSPATNVQGGTITLRVSPASDSSGGEDQHTLEDRDGMSINLS